MSSDSFTPKSWCLTEFHWMPNRYGVLTYHVSYGTRTPLLIPHSTTTVLFRRQFTEATAGIETITSGEPVPVIIADPPLPPPLATTETTPPTPTAFLSTGQVGAVIDECYPKGIESVLSAPCPSGWAYAATDGPTWTCCPFDYTLEKTRSIKTNTFIDTARCVSTFGLGSHRPVITIHQESLNDRIIRDMVGSNTIQDGVFGSLLYAEATPYRLIAPGASTGTGTSRPGPQETDTIPIVEPSSALSPGAAAGIAIGALLLLGVAGFYLWRYLRNRKTAGQISRNLEAGGFGGGDGPRMADCEDKEVVAIDAPTGNAKPPPYELDTSEPTTVVPVLVEADGVQTGHGHNVPELGGTAVEKGQPDTEVVQEPRSDPARPGPSRSAAVPPGMGGLEPLGMHAGEMSPATTVAMSSDSRPTSVMPEGGEWRNTVRVSYLQRELKNIRAERERLQRIEQLDAREAELERLVLEEMETLREGEGH